jgi:hypothetical protein
MLQMGEQSVRMVHVLKGSRSPHFGLKCRSPFIGGPGSPNHDTVPL